MGKTTNFSYEDFNEGSKQTYKANNFTRIERGGMKEDIISGRMINYWFAWCQNLPSII